MTERGPAAAGPLDLVRLAADYLGRQGIESPRLEAEVLLSHALGVSRLQLYLQYDRLLEAREVDAYREGVRRRGRREPTAYITGVREFWSLPLLVDKRVLIPRPETEVLVEAVLERMRDPEGDRAPRRVLDVGIGSGAVAIALLKERPDWTAVGVDASAEALCLAAENAARLGFASRIELRQGDLFAPLSGERFDVILSNPPYVPTDDIPALEPEVARHEPRLALDGGSDGLDAIRAIAAGAPDHLVEGGILALEFGWKQEIAVRAVLEAAGFGPVDVVQDYAEKPRVAVGRKNRES